MIKEEKLLRRIFDLTTSILILEKQVALRLAYSIRGVKGKNERGHKACLTVTYDNMPVLVVSSPLKCFAKESDLVVEVLNSEEDLVYAAIQTCGASGLRHIIYQALDGKGPVQVSLSGEDPPTIVNELNQN